MERIEVPIAEGRDPGYNDRDDFFDMANLFPKHTGLPFVVWISFRGGARHDVRVKVSLLNAHNGTRRQHFLASAGTPPRPVRSPGPKALPLEMASIAIRPDIRVVEGSLSSGHLALLSKWIEMNRNVLLRYWEGDIDTKDAIEAIQPIG